MAISEEEKVKLEEINAVMSNKSYQDIYQQLVDSIMNNDVPWQKPWDGNVGNELLGTPISGGSGRGYTGANKLFLTMLLNQLRDPEGNVDPRFYTYKQIEKHADKGYHLVKGAHGCCITMYFKNTLDKDGEPLPLEEQKWHKTYCTVFHPSQIRQSVYVLDKDGNKIPLLDKDGNQRIGKNGKFLYKMEDKPFPKYVPRFRPYTHEETNELIEILIKKSGAVISHDQGNRNFYRPGEDALHLTPPSTYKDINDYYRTALHELCHWTGHSSRLNRNLRGGFGSREYAREELRVEIAAAFICSNFNIPLSEQHGAYLKNWLEVLDKDPKEMEMAQREAHRIINYINNLVRDKVKELEAVRENPDSEYSDSEDKNKGRKNNPAKPDEAVKGGEGKSSKGSEENSNQPEPVPETPQTADSLEKLMSVRLHHVDDGMKWAGKSFIETVKEKLPIDFKQYKSSSADIIPAVQEKMTEYLMQLGVKAGDVLQVEDRLFYLNKSGKLSNIKENNFFQEVSIRNFKGMQIFAPLEGKKREQIKAEQIAQIGQEAFDAYRAQFRDVFFAGEKASHENIKDNVEMQYKKFIYDHTFDYGLSGIRPCDQKAWQKADMDFCLKAFENSMGDAVAMFNAVNIVQQHSPYAVANPKLEYSDYLTDCIMKNPEYQKIKTGMGMSKENSSQR